MSRTAEADLAETASLAERTFGRASRVVRR
jgi:hypothetical protein